MVVPVSMSVDAVVAAAGRRPAGPARTAKRAEFASGSFPSTVPNRVTVHPLACAAYTGTGPRAQRRAACRKRRGLAYVRRTYERAGLQKGNALGWSGGVLGLFLAGTPALAQDDGGLDACALSGAGRRCPA